VHIMDFKRLQILFTSLTVVIFFLASCSDNEKSNIKNTYYVEMVNFNHDSLKQNVSEKIFGKASFYKGDKVEIVSVNYLTDFPDDIHFYKNAAELGKDIKPETKKIRLEFGGKFTPDSITYSLQKFVYRDKQWKKTSDMGFIKAVNTWMRAKQFAIDQYGKQIVNETVLYTYN
jgi:hypothetical protein